jgi:plastocyanin
MFLAAALIGAAAPAGAETITVTIEKLVFAPAQVSAHVGDTIVWDNKDFIPHTATGRNHEWDVTIAAHHSAKIELTKPGTIDYFCKIHPNMKGQITVE